MPQLRLRDLESAYIGIGFGSQPLLDGCHQGILLDGAVYPECFGYLVGTVAVRG